MGQPRIPFESEAERELRITRNETRGSDGAQLQGYDAAGSGTEAVTGNETGPYSLPVGRASANGDGATPTGAVQVSNGEDQRLLTDEFGRLWTRTASPPSSGASLSISTVAEATRVIKASPGVIYRIAMLTVPGGLAIDTWLMVFDLAAPPGAGATPIWRALLNAPGAGRGGEVSDGWDPDKPIACVNGIAVGISSTIAAFTSAGAQAYFEALYE